MNAIPGSASTTHRWSQTAVPGILWTVLVLTAACHAAASGQVFEPASHTVRSPIAGKFEARVGGSYDADDQLRLDIGTSVDVLTIGDSVGGGDLHSVPTRMSLGADFFTWSRLRAEPNFKFPVEDVDYYFGVHASMRLNAEGATSALLNELRLRVAHISAHAVDGDPALRDSAWGPRVYSREFLDFMAGSNGARIGRLFGLAPASIRPYLGALWIFHNIPDVKGRASPYLGVDVEAPLGASLPLVARAGYEARVSTEVDPAVLEHHVRGGIKIGRPGTSGVVLEVGYSTGISPYGQDFGAEASRAFVGFAIEF